jgi:hypothetical protein
VKVCLVSLLKVYHVLLSLGQADAHVEGVYLLA